MNPDLNSVFHAPCVFCPLSVVSLVLILCLPEARLVNLFMPVFVCTYVWDYLVYEQHVCLYILYVSACMSGVCLSLANVFTLYLLSSIGDTIWGKE